MVINYCSVSKTAETDILQDHVHKCQDQDSKIPVSSSRETKTTVSRTTYIRVVYRTMTLTKR